MAIQIDFIHDWTEILRADLTARGYANSIDTDPERMALQFFNLRKRLISPRPRNILKAPAFSCPPAEQAGLVALEEKIARGEDITPHLSTRLTDLDYDDDLLNDWGVHHLHLGLVMMSPPYEQFIARTGPVLFAKFDSDKAYFIDVRSHGRGVPQPWTRQEMIRILHDNWPQSINRYRLNVEGLVTPPSDEDIRITRTGHVNSLVQLEAGVVYAPPGGGLSTSGISAEVVMTSDRAMIQLDHFEKWLRNNEAMLREGAVRLPDPMVLRLQIENDWWTYAVEQSTGFRYKLGRLLG